MIYLRVITNIRSVLRIMCISLDGDLCSGKIICDNEDTFYSGSLFGKLCVDCIVVCVV